MKKDAFLFSLEAVFNRLESMVVRWLFFSMFCFSVASKSQH